MKLTVNGKPRTVDVHPMSVCSTSFEKTAVSPERKRDAAKGSAAPAPSSIDGVPVDSCIVPVAHAEGCRVITIEGATATRTGKALQNAFVVYGGAQCGICTPGMILAAAPLKPGATLPEIQDRARRQSVPLHRLSGDLPIGALRVEVAQGKAGHARRR